MKTRNILAVASLIASLILGSTGVSFAVDQAEPDVGVKANNCNYMPQTICTDDSPAAQSTMGQKFDKEKTEASVSGISG